MSDDVLTMFIDVHRCLIDVRACLEVFFAAEAHGRRRLPRGSAGPLAEYRRDVDKQGI